MQVLNLETIGGGTFFDPRSRLSKLYESYIDVAQLVRYLLGSYLHKSILSGKEQGRDFDDIDDYLVNVALS
jgi:hypothetical protein